VDSGVGVLLFVTAPLGAALGFAGVPIPRALELFRGLYRFGLVVSSSVYLARNFARTNRELEAELAHVRELSARELGLQRERASRSLVSG
jgi:hypothetical protein